MQFRLVNLFSHSSQSYDAADIWEAMETIKRDVAPKYRIVLMGQDKAGLLLQRIDANSGASFDFRLELAHFEN